MRVTMALPIIYRSCHDLRASRQSGIMTDVKPAFCFVGFGEAGQAIASGLRETGIARMSAWDILFPQRHGEQLVRAAETLGVRHAVSAADAVRGSDIIVSAVTAASSLEAAR